MGFSVHQWSGIFVGITRWDPSVCKSNRLYFDILRFSYTKLGYTLWIPLKWSVIFLQSWTSTSFSSNSTGSSGTNCRFSPIMDCKADVKRLVQAFRGLGHELRAGTPAIPSADELLGDFFRPSLSCDCTSDPGDFCAWPVETLGFASPTDYMLTSSSFPILDWGTSYKFL